MKYIVIAILTLVIVRAIQTFRNKKGNLLINNSDLLEAGQLLFPELKQDFDIFFNTFIKDKKTFLADNEKILEDYDNFELDNLKPIEAIYIFGDSKEKLWMTDWRGEENEREIENFIDSKLKIKSDWAKVNELRMNVGEEKQRDGDFIIELLKFIDKDLESINKRLIFLDLGWDAYVYTVVDLTKFKTISEKYRTFFYGTEKLRK